MVESTLRAAAEPAFGSSAPGPVFALHLAGTLLAATAAASASHTRDSGRPVTKIDSLASLPGGLCRATVLLFSRQVVLVRWIVNILIDGHVDWLVSELDKPTCGVTHVNRAVVW